MNYSLFKLKFHTAVHFGTSESALSLYESDDHFHADTLFSGLCHMAIHLYGQPGLDRLIDDVKSGSLLFSDSMPWHNDDYYIPKPFFFTKRDSLQSDYILKKRMKHLKWIPISEFANYKESLRGGSPFDPTVCFSAFGMHSEETKVQVSSYNDSQPYQLGTYYFQQDCGLYFICGFDSEQTMEQIRSLVDALGISGIGGKISSGYGKFSVSAVYDLSKVSTESLDWLQHSLNRSDASSYFLLTTALPNDSELDAALEGAYYHLLRRGGFVASDSYSEIPQKKDCQFFLSAGSILQKKFCGDLYCVGKHGNHPVFRYSKPILLGVDL